MKIARFNHDKLGVIKGDWIADVTAALSHLPPRTWPGAWGDPLISALPQLLPRIEESSATAPLVPLSAVRLNSPVASPSKVIGAPANFAVHIEESKADAAIAASGPIKTIAEHGLFLKASSSLVGFGDGISLRFPDRRTDHEAEFVVVIGTEGADIAEDRALDYVAGYSLGLDVTLRGSEERSFRKSIDSYTVLGPWLVTKDEITNPGDVQFRLRVNGVLKQDANTRDMLFGVAQLIALASRFYRLYPGDLIFTGAPAGVGQIKAGDRIDVECAGIGAGTVSVAGGPAAASAGVPCTSDLDQLYENVRAAELQPLWIDTQGYVPRQPSPGIAVAHWPSEQLFGLLRRAGQSVPSEFADRRALVCKNPALPRHGGTTQTLYACAQLLLPGERAAEHRHSQSAFRFVLWGDGASTILNGQPVAMTRGDFIVTPCWTWHAHANESQNEVIWLDGLDNAIVRMFDATFFQLPFSEDTAAADVPPPAVTTHHGQWRYGWDDMLAAIDRAQRAAPPDPAHGYRVRYLDPGSGRDPLPTISAFLSRLPAGFSGQPYRSSDSTVFVAARGNGRTEAGGRTIVWRENDIFTVPTWVTFRHVVEDHEAMLFSFSDRTAQERLECWREDRHVS